MFVTRDDHARETTKNHAKTRDGDKRLHAPRAFEDPHERIDVEPQLTQIGLTGAFVCGQWSVGSSVAFST